MSNLESRLRKDADSMKSIGSHLDSQALRAALPPRAAANTQSPALRWFSWLVPVAVAASAMWFLSANPTLSTAPGEITPAATPLAQRQAVRPTIDLSALQQVSSTAPLEAEWEALMKDLERARDQIGEDIPATF